MKVWLRTTASSGAAVVLVLVLFAFGGTALAGDTRAAAQAERSVDAGMQLPTCEDPGTGGVLVVERVVPTGRAGSMRAV